MKHSPFLRKLAGTTVLVIALFIMVGATAQEHQLQKLWQTDSILKVPESVLYDASAQILYFSNITGKPDQKDQVGSIGKIKPDGTGLVVDWITGLSAPKGLGILNSVLYVADVDEVVAIDIAGWKISQRIPIAGAAFLNDITIDPAGVVYVSDSKKGTIHMIKNGQPSLYLDNIPGVNGVLFTDNGFYFLAKGVLWKAGPNKERTKIAEGMEESTDGIEQTTNKDFVVSAWVGVVYYVKADGSKTQMLDTRPMKLNTADIGFDASKQIVYVPTFFGNSITAYQLK
jgi:sugar lactone lactonase YvrE